MIDPTEEDIGRAVKQRQYVGGPERNGVIRSFGPAYIYVQYAGFSYSEPTVREELFYASDR